MKHRPVATPSKPKSKFLGVWGLFDFASFILSYLDFLMILNLWTDEC